MCTEQMYSTDVQYRCTELVISHLHQQPLVHISGGLTPEVLCEILLVHVVEELRHVGHVEDVEVKKVVIHQLPEHRFT